MRAVAPSRSTSWRRRLSEPSRLDRIEDQGQRSQARIVRDAEICVPRILDTRLHGIRPGGWVGAAPEKVIAAGVHAFIVDHSDPALAATRSFSTPCGLDTVRALCERTDKTHRQATDKADPAAHDLAELSGGMAESPYHNRDGSFAPNAHAICKLGTGFLDNGIPVLRPDHGDDRSRAVIADRTRPA